MGNFFINIQRIPPGELSIQGISSDDKQTDCQVYADVNDVTPMRNVTATEDIEEDNDFSQWTFTYSQDYQLIKLGENELTAKISCSDNGKLTLIHFLLLVLIQPLLVLLYQNGIL